MHFSKSNFRQPMVESIRKKCRESLEDFMTRGSSSKIVQSQRHTRVLANLCHGGLLSYLEDEIGQKSRVHKLNLRIREKNALKWLVEQPNKTVEIIPLSENPYEEPVYQAQISKQQKIVIPSKSMSIIGSERESIYNSTIRMDSNLGTHQLPIQLPSWLMVEIKDSPATTLESSVSPEKILVGVSGRATQLFKKPAS